jgi:hypothetical protein
MEGDGATGFGRVREARSRAELKLWAASRDRGMDKATKSFVNIRFWA